MALNQVPLKQCHLTQISVNQCMVPRVGGALQTLGTVESSRLLICELQEAGKPDGTGELEKTSEMAWGCSTAEENKGKDRSQKLTATSQCHTALGDTLPHQKEGEWDGYSLIQHTLLWLLSRGRYQIRLWRM